MRNEDSKSKDLKVDPVNVDFAVTLAKLVEDNDRLKKRVDVLEKSFKDKLASLEQENDTLQKHLSAMISLTETELRRERSESKNEARRSGNQASSDIPDDDRRTEHRTSQYCKRFKSSFNKSSSSSTHYRDIIESSHDGRTSSNRHKSYDNRRSDLYCKSVKKYPIGDCKITEHLSNRTRPNERSNDERRSRGSSQRSSTAERTQHRDLRYSEERYRGAERFPVENQNRRSIQQEGRLPKENIPKENKHSRVRSPKEKKNESNEVCIPSSHEITLWTGTTGMQFIQNVDLRKIYTTPMKFIPFSDYKLISPLPNTPDQLKEKFKELGNKISPIPLLMNENQTDQENQVKEDTGRAAEAKPVVLEHQSELQSGKEDDVEVQTVIKTDDVEHGVFRRKRRA